MTIIQSILKLDPQILHDSTYRHVVYHTKAKQTKLYHAKQTKNDHNSFIFTVEAPIFTCKDNTYIIYHVNKMKPNQTVPNQIK